ncbi:MAG: hypothetical protein QW165_01170 [Candidatus Woesearchaeota archaeon]
MATATERKVVGMTQEERLAEIEACIAGSREAFERREYKKMNSLLLRAYTLGSQL